MKKFSINELLANEESSANATSQNGTLRSPSSLSMLSSTSINHSNQSHPSERPSFPGNAINMVQSNDSQRVNHFFQNENQPVIHNDNINWRDEADGSEEEESRLNLVPIPSIPSTSDAQFNASEIHAVPPNSQLPFMSEQDLRNSSNNNCSENVANANFKSTSFNAKAKQLHEAESYLNRIDDMVQSFKKLLKINENNQHNQCVEDNFKNISVNRKVSLQSSPKVASLSRSNYSSQLSNNLNPYPTNNNFTFPKVNDLILNGNVRNNKNRKQTNNRPVVDLNQNEFQLNTLIENDLSTEANADNNGRGRVYNRLLSSITHEIESFRRELQHLWLLMETTDVTQNNFHDTFALSNNYTSDVINNGVAYDLGVCNSFPASLLHNDNTFNSNYRIVNQQVHQLLMQQNHQITLQHQLILSWMQSQQKWLEKQSGNLFKQNVSVFNSCTSENIVNNDNHSYSTTLGNEDIPINNLQTLNNQTVPTTRANNFWDNFKSQSCQNKLSSNRDIYSFCSRSTNEPTNNCTNTCVNSGNCTKNSRSQSFSVHNISSLNNRKNQNNSTPKSAPNSITNPNMFNSLSDNESPYQVVKKLNFNVEKNMLEIKQLLSLFEKQMERNIPNNPFHEVPLDLSNSKSANVNRFSPLNCANSSNKSGFKRKKVSNIEFNLPEHIAQDSLCKCHMKHCNMNSTKLPNSDKLSFFPMGNKGKSSLFSSRCSQPLPTPPPPPPPSSSSSSSLYVPFHISPCTGAIRKKPMIPDRDVGLLNFAVRDTQKSVQQDNGSLCSENVRPLMPAEGRSSETNSNVPLPQVTFLMLAKSTQKLSTRPPITGAGNESSTNSGKDNTPNDIDAYKWVKVNLDSDSVDKTKDVDKKVSFSSEQNIEEETEDADNNQLSEIDIYNDCNSNTSSCANMDTRNMEPNEVINKENSEPIIPQSTQQTSTGKTSDQCKKPDESLRNGHIEPINSAFDNVIPLSNGHVEDDEQEDNNKENGRRLLPVVAGNAVEVRSTVRLSGDGEQGL